VDADKGKVLADRLHNQPENKELGPCSCPIHVGDCINCDVCGGSVSVCAIYEDAYGNTVCEVCYRKGGGQ